MPGGQFKGLEQIVHTTAEVFGFQQHPRKVHIKVFIIPAQLQGTLVILQRLLQHLVFAQADAEIIEQVLVFRLKGPIKLDQAFKNVLRLVGVAALKVCEADAEVGAYVVLPQ